MGINEVWRQEVQSYETLGILAEFHNVFLLEFSVPLLAIFSGFFDRGFLMDNGVLFIGKAL